MHHLFLSTLLLFAMAAVNGSAATRPNVVLVITDDQGYGDIGAHGNQWIRTPNLDRLHGESVRFTGFHVDPTCTPTRGALMTGRYSTRTGCWHTILGRSLIFHDEVLMPELFREAGYRTGMFGKWHLGDNYPMRPMDRGFEEVVRHGGGGVGQTPDWWGNDYFDDTYWHNGTPKPFEGYCTEVFFNEAIRFVDAHKTKPFFLYLPTNVPHGPFNVPEGYADRYREMGIPNGSARFLGMIEHFDEQLGRLMAHLDETGLARNTIFIFMTDNGTAAGFNPSAREGAWSGFNAGMQGKKGSQYDGGHRVPFFVRWPEGGIGGGLDVDRLTAHFDVLPTLIELCGLRRPEGVEMDGRSLVPLMKESSGEWPDRSLFVHVQREEIPPKWVRSAVMTQQWRLVDGKELYDIVEDPGQVRDLSGDHPAVVARLRSDYESWWATLEPSLSRYGHIVIGNDAQNPAEITCHDWHSEEAVPWAQGHIRRADMWVNGYWMIDVAEAGEYQFILRRQPEIARHSIEATLARIRVGDVEKSVNVSIDDTEAVLLLDLPKGPTKMQTWLTHEGEGKTRGAYFVEVRKMD